MLYRCNKMTLYRQVQIAFALSCTISSMSVIYFLNNQFSRTGLGVCQQFTWMNYNFKHVAKYRRHAFFNQTLLSALTQGYWKPKNVTDEERNNVTARLMRFRSRKKIEYSAIGNLTCGHAHGGYRALCNPETSNACCKENLCQDIPVEDCRCPTCFDERSRIYPEFYEWTSYSVDKRTNVSIDEVCTALRKLNVASIVTIGDSLIRQVTFRFWKRFYVGPVIHLLGDASPQELIQKCRPNATNWGSHKCWERSYVRICDGIKFFYRKVFNIAYHPKEFEDLQMLRRENSGRIIVLTNVGLHDNLSIRTTSFYLKMILQEVECLGDTDLLYIPPYPPGLQKSPKYSKQTSERTFKLIKYFRTFTNQRNISFLDPSELVKDLVSSDGTHYTRGLNDAMVDIIVNCIVKGF